MSGGQHRGAIRTPNQCAAHAAPRAVELPGGAGKHDRVYALGLVGRVLVGRTPAQRKRSEIDSGHPTQRGGKVVHARLQDWHLVTGLVDGGRQCSCAIPAIRRRCRRISFCWTVRRPCRQHPKFRFAHPSLPCRVNQSFTVSDRYSCRAGGVSVGKHTHVRVRALESRKGDRPVWSRVDEYRGGRASVDTPWPGSIPAKTYCTCFGALMAELPRHHHLIPKRYSIFC